MTATSCTKRAQGYRLSELEGDLGEANAAADPDGKLALAYRVHVMVYYVVPRELREAISCERLSGPTLRR